MPAHPLDPPSAIQDVIRQYQRPVIAGAAVQSLLFFEQVLVGIDKKGFVYFLSDLSSSIGTTPDFGSRARGLQRSNSTKAGCDAGGLNDFAATDFFFR